MQDQNDDNQWRQLLKQLDGYRMLTPTAALKHLKQVHHINIQAPQAKERVRIFLKNARK